jgi:hypothetical protein
VYLGQKANDRFSLRLAMQMVSSTGRFLGVKTVTKELNQAAVSLKADGRALTLTGKFVPIAVIGDIRILIALFP